jgi:hypothetical protein
MTAVRSRSSRSLSAIATLLAMAIAPVAFAQTTTPPKHKKKKPAATAPADSASAEPAATAAPEPAAAPPPEPAPPPADSAAAATPPPKATEVPNTPPDETAWSITDTHEDPGKSYKFIGLRYRGNVIPQFLENLFVDDGATIYSNSFAVEFDLRRNGASTIPWIQYSDYNTGDILFLQKGKDDTAPGAVPGSFHSVVNSSLKAIYVGVDELWSVPLKPDKLEFEYGLGVGVGVVFGDLRNNWVFDSGSSGPLVGGNGHHYTPCASTTQGPGCNPANHTDPVPAKVNGHTEPNWFNAGAVPSFFVHIAVPQFSLRYKPIKQLETRLSVGFSLTGFWFGLSADYGLEQRPEAAHKTGLQPTLRDTL